jgi:hypothetical protein
MCESASRLRFVRVFRGAEFTTNRIAVARVLEMSVD